MTDTHSLDNVRIVLVNTSHPGNIGAVARAMKNMCLSQLYLVAPRKFPHDEATWRAASAGDILDNAVVCETLDEAIADCHLVVGTSARERTVPWPLLNPRHCMEEVYREAGAGHRVALMFGREDRGLTNEELQRCNLHVHIPSNPEYSSLNLGMAVVYLGGGRLQKGDAIDPSVGIVFHKKIGDEVSEGELLLEYYCSGKDKFETGKLYFNEVVEIQSQIPVVRQLIYS